MKVTISMPLNSTTTIKMTQKSILDFTNDIHNASEAQDNNTQRFNYSQIFLSCENKEFIYHNFQILENDILYIPKYASLDNNGLYTPGEYLLSENGVWICLYPTNITRVELITSICMSLSLICLLLHFLAFILVPDMRNLPGKNLASLNVSLFMTYLLFLIGRLEYYKTRVCYPIGLAHYYFMMASIFWMNAISFNIFHSFRQATTKFRLISKDSELKSFVFYSLYSWTSPAIFLIIVIVGDETTFFPKYLKPGLKSDQSLCWFNGEWSGIIYFMVPLGITVAINSCFFLSSIYTIFSSMQTDNQIKKWRKIFIIYIKLSILMGFGLTMGYLGIIAQTSTCWYIFSIVTTLQGFFIFVAFTRFRMTREKLLHLFRRCIKWNFQLSVSKTEIQ